MSEPEVPTVTASVPRSGSGSRAASGCGLSESLHAVAPSSIATAAANQHRPPPRTMRLPPEGSLPPLQFAAPRGQKPDRLLVQRLQQVSAVSPRRARGTVPRRCAVASGRHRHHGPLPRRNSRAAGSVAKLRATLGFRHGRRLYLNMVAGGFKNALEALNDPTPHDERYARLVEYTTLIMQLLGSTRPVTLNGRYYRVTQVKLTPPLDPALKPGVFVSGSSDAGLAAARQLGALAVRYPKPVAEYEAAPPIDAAALGIRIGIIAREEASEAWAVARGRFPEDRQGQLTHQLAMKVTDSEWHKQLSRLGETAAAEDQPYWMVPFENYKTFCPYLVGSYERVADEIARYVGVGYRTIILDVPASLEELEHIGVVCERAAARVTP